MKKLKNSMYFDLKYEKCDCFDWINKILEQMNV